MRFAIEMFGMLVRVMRKEALPLPLMHAALIPQGTRITKSN